MEKFQVAPHGPKHIQITKATCEWADAKVPTDINVSNLTNWALTKMEVTSRRQQSQNDEESEKTWHDVKILSGA